jgi:D-glycero-D-manno-heptose 1,7-bisphosphate phosphatase
MNISVYSDDQDNQHAGLVIFDRDGTLIENIKGLRKVSEIVWKPRRLSLLKELTELKYTLAIATNQGAVEEGLISEDELQIVHNEIASDIYEAGGQLWSIAYCPHGRNLSGANCTCRKPQPGMLDMLSSKYMHKNSPIFFVGDSETDRLAAQFSASDIIYLDSNMLFESNEPISDRFTK